MGESIKNFLHGFGGVLNIAPHNNYFDMIPKHSPQEILARDFQRVGDDIRSAMKVIDAETKQTETNS
ncbi:MAG: hypothetical protein Q9M21_09785 [Mariprofundaceae bacterium]|nr:hypothetical protein [Mariprofundaceae bacterium]